MASPARPVFGMMAVTVRPSGIVTAALRLWPFWIVAATLTGGLISMAGMGSPPSGLAEQRRQGRVDLICGVGTEKLARLHVGDDLGEGLVIGRDATASPQAEHHVQDL